MQITKELERKLDAISAHQDRPSLEGSFSAPLAGTPAAAAAGAAVGSAVVGGALAGAQVGDLLD